MKQKCLPAIVAGGILFFQTSSFAAEIVHNHTSFHGGQVGMSGDYHIELIVRRSGIYQVYLTDMNRKVVPIDQVRAKLSVNLHTEGTDVLEPEYVPLKIKDAPAGYFYGRGKSWKKSDVVDVTLAAILANKDVVFVEFIEPAKEPAQKKS